jgi:hypothetical protein
LVPWISRSLDRIPIFFKKKRKRYHPFATKNSLTLDSSFEDDFVCLPCSNEEERVCWQHKDENEPKFIYMHQLLFEKLWILLPYSKFQCDILVALNVAPTQLHPNTRGFVEILCSCVGIEHSVNKFLYFFQVKVFGKVEWISASGRSVRRLLNAFDTSYKNWKNMFFRVRSIHWTTDHVLCTIFEVARFDEVEQDEVQQLSCLSVFYCANSNPDPLYKMQYSYQLSYVRGQLCWLLLMFVYDFDIHFCCCYRHGMEA